MYGFTTYRSAGAEALIYPISIDILLRWSKEALSVLCVNLVAVNINEVSATSYTELTFEKNCPNYSLQLV